MFCRTGFYGRIFILPASIAAATLCLTSNRLTAEPVDPASPAPNAGSLSITIDESRIPLVAGTSFSLSATLTNNTESTIVLNEEHLRLKVPAEIEGSDATPASSWAGILLAADHSKATEQNPFAVLALKPHQQTSVWWRWSRPLTQCEENRTCTVSAVHKLYRTFADYVFFEPGPYRMTITANYGTEANPTANVALETTTVNVAAPQRVILMGAALGGLLAFLILPKARRRLAAGTKWHRFARAVAGPGGAMLLSVIMTILLARLSETQFVIRVTVSDLWGAIAVGFIANYLGVEALNKITNLREQLHAPKAT